MHSHREIQAGFAQTLANCKASLDSVTEATRGAKEATAQTRRAIGQSCDLLIHICDQLARR